MIENKSRTMHAAVDAVYRSESRRVFATLVRLLGDFVRNSRISITDRPWVKTKEQLGGYYLIDARDLNETIQIAAIIPSARIGCIEVRPIRPIRDTVAAAQQRIK